MTSSRVFGWSLALGALLGAPGCSALLGWNFSGGGGADAGLDAPGLDAPGADAPGIDAPLPDTPGTASVTVTLTGMGTVTSDPAGISCGATCTADFAAGSMVTLTATPDATSSFLGWSGGCTGTSPTCALTLMASATVQASFAPRGSVRWVNHVSFPGQESFSNDVGIGPDGNPIVGTLVDDGDGSDLYVAKLDRATGEILWDTLLDTPTGEYFGGLAVDDEGNAYAAVTISGFGGTFSVAGTTFTADLFGNIAVFRFDAATGDVDWAVQWGGDAQDRPQGVAVAGTNLFVIGETSGTATFGGPLFTIAGSSGDGFVVRASTMTGGVNRVAHFDGNFRMSGVAANATNVAVTGSFTADATVPCTVRRSGVGSDFMLVSLVSSDLSCAWARTAGDSTSGNDADGFAVAPEPDGGWAATGVFEGSALWATSGTFLTSAGAADVFAVRYGPTGDHIWSFRYGTAGSEVGTAIATTPTGETFLTGTFQTSITFGARTLMAPGHVFVTRMSAGATPTHDWAVALGGDGSDRTEGLAVDADGNVYAAAYFNGMTALGGDAYTAADYDNWVVALVP